MEEKKVVKLLLGIGLVYSLCNIIIQLSNSLPNFLSKANENLHMPVTLLAIFLILSQVIPLYLLYKNNKYAGIVGAIFPIISIPGMFDGSISVQSSIDLLILVICLFYTIIYFKKKKK